MVEEIAEAIAAGGWVALVILAIIIIIFVIIMAMACCYGLVEQCRLIYSSGAAEPFSCTKLLI